MDTGKNTSAQPKPVILEFADMEAARKFQHSDEYAPGAAMRHASADCTVLIIDGID